MCSRLFVLKGAVNVAIFGKRRNKLKDITVKSVDVCTRGANQEADIVLTKSMEGGETVSVYNRITKMLHGMVSDAIAEKLDVFEKAMQASEDSIVNDESMDDEAKIDMLNKSMDQYFEAINKAIAEDDEDPDEEDPDDDYDEEEDDDDMEFDVTKMSDEDRALFEGMKKKYGKKQVEKSDEIHPEVKKAMDEVAELRKSLEMAELTNIAKQYEVCGKKPEELAEKLYAMKKSDSAAYDEYVSLLDEMKKTHESGIFKEYGSNRSGAHTDLSAAVGEVRKQFPNLSAAEAVVKAYELNPELSETM